MTKPATLTQYTLTLYMFILLSICCPKPAYGVTYPGMTTDSAYNPHKIFHQTFSLAEDHFWEKRPGKPPWHSLFTEAKKHITNKTPPHVLKAMIQGIFKKVNIPEKSITNDHDQLFWTKLPIVKPHLDSYRINHIGAWFKRKGRRWFVQYVFPKTPSASSGLRRGDEIIKVNKAPFSPIYSFITSNNTKTTTFDLEYKRLPWGQVKRVTLAPIKTSYRSLMRKVVTAPIQVITVKDKKIAYLPLLTVTNSQDLKGLVEKIHMYENVCSALVLDLREGVDKATKDIEKNLFIKKKQFFFTKKIIAIINNETEGTREGIAKILKEKKLATLIGKASSGMGAQQIHHIYADNRWLLSLPAQKNLKNISRVMPDIYEEDLLVYSAGVDSLLEKAIKEAAK